MPKETVIFNKPDSAICEGFRYFGTKTRFAGDIVMTGTPEGVSTYREDGRFRVELFCQNDILLQKRGK